MKLSENLGNIKFLCMLIGLICAFFTVAAASPIFALSLLILFLLDFVNFGPLSFFYEVQWRYKKFITKEKEHDWGDWIHINGGMEKIRFCKNCGKMDKI